MNSKSRPIAPFWAGAALLYALVSATATANVLEFVETLEGPPTIGDPKSLAVSPDGRHLYLASAEDDNVAVFDTASTPLELVATAPVKRPFAMVVSADGRHVYVSSIDDDTITVFRRDEASGALSFVEAETDGVDGVDGIGGPFEMDLSPDGRHLYVSGTLDDAVATFRRDESSGALSFVEAIFDTPELGLDGVYPMAISPDGRHLYVGSVRDGQVTRFESDEVTGKLTILGTVLDDTATKPLDLAISPDGRYLYMATDAGGAIYERDANTGALTYASAFPELGLDVPADTLAVSSDGLFVYGTSYRPPSRVPPLKVYARDPSSGGLSLVEERNDYFRDLYLLAQARDVAVSPDDRRVFVVGEDADALTVLERDPESGALSLADVRIDGEDGIDGLLGASSVAVSPDGRYVYVSGALDDALAVFKRDPHSGRLSFVETLVNGVAGVEALDGAWTAAISPDGRHLYVIGSRNAVSVFERHASDGTLSFVESQFVADEVVGPGLAVSPDGSHVYLGRFVFARDESDGTLSPVGDVLVQDIPTSIVISSDGRYLYMAEYSDVLTFERDPTTGLLTFLEMPSPFDGVCVFEDSLGVPNFCYPFSLAISPDDRFLYVGLRGEISGGVMAFERDSDTGLLTHFATYVEAEGYLFSALPPEIRSLTVAPDGHHLYAVSNAGDGLVVFSRDRATGTLAFTEAHYDDTAGLDGLDGPAVVAVSPDSRNIYVAAFGEDTVTAFKKGCVTGTETLCLEGERFQVDVEWRDFAGNIGTARTVPVDSDNSGLFWFFAADNSEMLVKVLDGCGVNDRFWVFAAATTNVEYRLRVMDLETGVAKSYFNPLGNASAAITDTGAFATCP